MIKQISVNVHAEWADRAIKAGKQVGGGGGRSSLLVLLLLVQCRKLEKSNPFRLDYSVGRIFGLPHSRTIKRYLPRLESWGLIEVEYFAHAAPMVKLLGDTRKPPEIPLEN